MPIVSPNGATDGHRSAQEQTTALTRLLYVTQTSMQEVSLIAPVDCRQRMWQDGMGAVGRLLDRELAVGPSPLSMHLASVVQTSTPAGSSLWREPTVHSILPNGMEAPGRLSGSD